MRGWGAFAASAALHALVLVGVGALVWGANHHDAPVRVRVVGSPTQPGLAPSGGDQGAGVLNRGSGGPAAPRPQDPPQEPTPAPANQPVNEGDPFPPPLGIEAAAPETEAPGAGFVPPSRVLPDRSAQPASDLRPPYPREARRRGWEGTVGLDVSVDAQGRVVGVVLKASSGHPVLDRAAADAAEGAAFLPAVRGGIAEPATVAVTVHFRLR